MAVLAVTLSLTGADVAHANEPPCAVDDRPADVVIDARHGAVQGARHFRKRALVRVCVTNMNPFVFEYDIEGQVHRVAEPALADIATLLVPGAPGTAPTAATRTTPPVSAGTRAMTTTPDPCPARLAALQGQATALATAVAASRVRAEETRKALESMAAAWNLARRALFEGDASTAAELRAAATQARNALDVPATAQPSEAQFEAIAEQLIALRVGLKELTEEGTCASRDLQFVQEARRQVEETHGAFLPEARETRRAQSEALARLHALRDALARVLGRPDAFDALREFGPFDEPTDVSVHVRRRPIGGESSTLAEVKLNFGGSARFAYSTGAVMATLDRDTYARVDGVQDGAARAFVGYEERAATRTRFLAMAHARLFDLDHEASLFATLGRVLDTENELLVGLSVGLAENRFLLTVGAYRGPRDVLETGFAVGQALPAEFTAEVPVRKQFEWSVAAGVSIRIK
jgi:hypothetical protein